MSKAMSHSEMMRGSDSAALKEKAAAAKDAVVDLASEAKHYATGQVHHLKTTATGLAMQAKAKAGRLGDKTVEHVQRHPYRSLAIAAGIGFVTGLLMKRR